MKDEFFKLTNAPDEAPIAFQLGEGKAYLDKDAEDDDSVIDLGSVHAVANMKSTVAAARPEWLKQFFNQMNTYVSSSGGENVEIDPETGALSLGAKMAKSELRKLVENLAWLVESQHRQTKEILLWIGECILDFIARDTRQDLTVEEAIEELGLLERENGYKWSMKTLVKWPVVISRIPASIRSLPIPPTYLSEAALFAMPEDPQERIAFGNARDVLLMSVADKPNVWSRSTFVACMKELQDRFGIERQRNEGTSALLLRLIDLYRLRDNYSEDTVTGISKRDVADWIYNIENELISRDRLPASPTGRVPTSDGLTKGARERIAREQASK